MDGIANPPLGVHIRREFCERASGRSDQPTARGASRVRLKRRNWLFIYFRARLIVDWVVGLFELALPLRSL